MNLQYKGWKPKVKRLKSDVMKLTLPLGLGRGRDHPWRFTLHSSYLILQLLWRPA